MLLVGSDWVTVLDAVLDKIDRSPIIPSRNCFESSAIEFNRVIGSEILNRIKSLVKDLQISSPTSEMDRIIGSNVSESDRWVRNLLSWVTRSMTGIVSSGNAWERRSQSYFDSGNGVPRNSIVR